MNPDSLSASPLTAPPAPRAPVPRAPVPAVLAPIPAPASSAPAAAPVPAKRPRWWRVFATKRFLFISILLHLLLALGATVWIVQVTYFHHEPSFSAAPPSAAKAASHALEHQVKMAKKQASMSAPPAVKRVTTKSAAKVALPAMPALPKSQPVTPTAMSGSGVMPGAGFGFGSGMGGGGSGGGGGGLTNFIGGMRITAQKLGIALDISGSVAAYQQEMHEYTAKVFKGSEVSEFSAAGFFSVKSARGSMGLSVLGFLNSPKHFDAIYIFSDFGETYEKARRPDQEDLWPQVQKLVREKKVRLYLHILPLPRGNTQDSPEMNSLIQLARSSGGAVKTGPMTKVNEGNTGGNAASGAAKL